MIKIVKGDITTLAVDAIVNVANQVMLENAPKKLVSEGNFERSENLSEAKALKRSRGGVDGAIHDAAGEELFEACLKVPEVRPGVRCPTGDGAEEMEVIFCCFSERDAAVYERLLK